MIRKLALLAGMSLECGQARWMPIPTGHKVGLRPFTHVQLVQLALDAGFPPQVAAHMARLAQRESRGEAGAHRVGPKDDSWGLWQINMLGRLAPSRMRLFGLCSPAELADPRVNARAAYRLWKLVGLKAWRTK